MSDIFELLCDDMCLALETDDWARVEHLNKEYCDEVTKWLDKQPRENETQVEQVRIALQQMLHRYKTIIDVCDKKRTQFAESAKTIRHSKEAQQSYISAAHY